MYQGISKFFVVLVLSMSMLACATTNVLEKQLRSKGGQQLNAEQVKAHLSGKTQRWETGAAYFKPDGALYMKWGGKLYPERVWTVDDDGKVCIEFRDGFRTSCSTYYNYQGDVWAVTLTVFGEVLVQERPFRYRRDGSIEAPGNSIFGGPDEIYDGNRLAEF